VVSHLTNLLSLCSSSSAPLSLPFLCSLFGMAEVAESQEDWRDCHGFSSHQTFIFLLVPPPPFPVLPLPCGRGGRVAGGLEEGLQEVGSGPHQRGAPRPIPAPPGGSQEQQQREEGPFPRPLGPKHPPRDPAPAPTPPPPPPPPPRGGFFRSGSSAQSQSQAPSLPNGTGPEPEKPAMGPSDVRPQKSAPSPPTSVYK